MSPALRIISSSFVPVPTAITSPRRDFSLAESGMMIPLTVFSSWEAGRTRTRSARGRILIELLLNLECYFVCVLSSFSNHYSRTMPKEHPALPSFTRRDKMTEAVQGRTQRRQKGYVPRETNNQTPNTAKTAFHVKHSPLRRIFVSRIQH